MIQLFVEPPLVAITWSTWKALSASHIILEELCPTLMYKDADHSISFGLWIIAAAWLFSFSAVLL